MTDSCSSFENLHNTELKSNGLISFTEETSKQQNTKDLCRATGDFSYGNLQRKGESHLGYNKTGLRKKN